MKRRMIFVKSPKSMITKIMRVSYDLLNINYYRMKARKLISLGIVLSFLSLAQFAVAEVIVERLDSITYTNPANEEVKKEKIQYTEDGLVTSHITFDFVTSDTITLTYTYNEDKQLIEKLTAATSTNWSGEKVTNESKEEYTYDENGVLNQTTTISQWQSYRTSTVTNDRGLLEEESSYTGFGDTWNLDEKRAYTYDNEDCIVSVQIYMGSEEVTDEEIYVYTEEDGVTTRIGTGVTYIDPETYETGETPYDSWKDEQTTDEEGTIVFYEKYSWSIVFDENWVIAGYDWTGDTKYTTTKSGSTTTTNRYAWNSANAEWYLNTSTEEMLVGSMWNPNPTARWITEFVRNPDYDENDPESGEELIGSKRTIYSLSNGGIVLRKVTSNLANIGGSVGWTTVQEENYIIDESISLDQIYAPATLVGDPYFFTHKPISVEKHTFAETTYTTDRVAYHYTSPEEPVDIPTIKTSNHNVYLSGNTLVVETPNAETVSIYSVTGKLISTVNKAEGEANITTALTKGVYIVSGSTGWNAKVIK